MRQRKGFPTADTPEERFALRISTPTPTGCWLWLGGTAGGYGLFSYEGRRILAHRVIYEWLNGPIPKGIHIDHLCFIRLCVSPSHLEAVTPQENVRRAVARYRKVP